MWWEKLIDSGTGVFEKWVDFESVKQEADAARNYSLVSSANAASGPSTSGSFFGVSPLIIIGGVLVAGFLVLRK